jgi:NAD(P)-dependent dehydrogenase (short-subunit alcohol dehydrogenase family)
VTTSLKGKTAIVTGAGRGVGRGEALLLAKLGASVVVNDAGRSLGGESSGEEGHRPADQVVDLIKAAGGNALANYADVSDWTAAQEMVAQAVGEFGGLDILVNNAGILRDKVIIAMGEEDFDAVIRVHLKGSFAMTHHAARYWREQAKGGETPRAAIVNTVSSAGLQGSVGQVNYGAAKAGIAAMTIISSLELRRYGVRVNAVAPGGITRMSTGVLDGSVLRESEEYEEFHPMNPGNSAPMVAWLASDDSIPVTGQVMRAVGSTIARYEPWKLGEEIENPKGIGPWEPDDIGEELMAEVFHTRNPGLRLGRMQAKIR